MDYVERNVAIDGLRYYFGKDNRYTYMGYVSAGSFGSTHRVKFRDPETDVETQFLVKRAHDGEDPKEMLQEELQYLKMVRGAMHIARLWDLDDDPLSRYGYSYICPWLALEWVPNGTLYLFMYKAREAGLRRLPNRLLWRFFLCLVRGCIGMAWPMNSPDNSEHLELPVPNVPQGGLKHGDLHASNILLGEFSVGGEHAISPVLKIIDFGLGSSWSGDPSDTPVNANLAEVCILMLRLITLDPLYDLDLAVGDFEYLGQRYPTKSSLIFPKGPHLPRPYPWLDEWLATIVALCHPPAEDSPWVPTLATLNSWITYAILQRTRWFYDNADESDETITRLCRALILEPEEDEEAGRLRQIYE